MDFVKYSLRPRQAIIRLVCICLGSVVFAAYAWSQAEPDAALNLNAAEFVDRFAAEVNDLTAGFEQNVFDVDGELAETSTGQFLLLRPNRFAWYYETPYELDIVADGETLWMHDVDLEQITRAPLSDLAASPAMVLSGEGAVSEGFILHDLESGDDRRWIGLEPVKDDGEFQSARIAFRDGVPSALEFIDGLNQLTRIEFSDIDVNSGLRVRDFEFDPPRGVDIIGEDD
jgi:outer membrane lipoprotein carrier protein